MAKNSMPDVVLENVSLKFLNFSGRIDQYNANGRRKFSVVLPPEVARDMEKDGWNVKWPKPRPDFPDDDPFDPTLAVEASYRIFSPQITVVLGKRRVNYTEDMLDLLDTADIINVDLVIQPSFYDNPTGAGVKAYLKKAFITIEEDVLDKKYAHLEDGN